MQTDMRSEVTANPAEQNGASSLAAILSRRALALLWFGVIPALLTGLSLRVLLPAVVLGDNDAFRDALRSAQEHNFVLGAGLFLFFAGAARYWRFFLPGGRYLSVLPPHLVPRFTRSVQRAMADAASFDRSLKTRRMQNSLERSLDGERLAELNARLGELRAGLETGNEALVERSSVAARILAEAILARQRRRELLWAGLGIGVAAAAAFAVRGTLVESYSVLSGSMLPTLAPEDRVLGNRLAYRTWSRASSPALPRRGDIIVFKSHAVDDGNLVDAPEFLVKRVVGLPGDRISARRGIPVINGFTVPTCDVGEYLYVLHGGENGLDGRLLVEFLEDRAYLTVHAAGSAAFEDTYEVEPGELFVLGDNRNNSSDSRAWNNHHGGGVPIDAIEARVQWFVIARRADMTWDFSRILRPIDALSTSLHLEGVNRRPLDEGIARCLEKRPENTSPPAPGADPSRPPPDNANTKSMNLP
jgi:signal peptidase I